MNEDVFDRVRAACAEVARRARHVAIEAGRLAEFAAALASAPPDDAALDPALRLTGAPETKLAFVLTLDAVNFGSGWFPQLAKRPGLSGYLSLASALEEHFEKSGPWDARELRALREGACAEVFGQDRNVPEQAELMGLFARSLSDLGSWLLERFDGQMAGPLEEAGGCAGRLVELLAEMPLYRDVAVYRGLPVPLYKRAQITASDLAGSFHGEGWGRFRDLDRLTLFADNLVPHVLRCEGVLCYAPALARRIDAGALIESGSEEEIEIRALAVHAVERCVEEIRRCGGRATARQLDTLLWNRGQRPEYKARPRHRTRTCFY